MTSPRAEERSAELLDGAVDLHVHPAPSPFPRRISILEAATQAAEVGFSAIAVKSHHHSMTTDVLAVEAAVGKLPLEVLSGVCLNSPVGGLNVSAVDLCLNQGGRIVWMPTIASAKHLDSDHSLRTFPQASRPMRPQTPVLVTTEDGDLKPEVHEILELVRLADAVLSCGHLDAADIDLVVAAAQRAGVRRVLVSHPNFVIGASPERCSQWAAQGVFIEHSLCHYVAGSTFRKWELETMLEYVSAVGKDHTILSSDLGQAGNPTPVEAFAMIVGQLTTAGVPSATIRRLVGGSARALIG